MNYGNCKVCGKLVAYNKVRICNVCKEVELEKIKKYIEENGTIRINRLCKDLNIPEYLIVEFINNGSLETNNFYENEIEGLLEKERRRILVDHLKTLNHNNIEIESKKEELKIRGKMRFLNLRKK